jgi:hypothetical protein
MEYDMFKRILLSYGAIYFPYTLIDLRKSNRVERIDRVLGIDSKPSLYEIYLVLLEEHFKKYCEEFKVDISVKDPVYETPIKIESYSHAMKTELLLSYAGWLQKAKAHERSMF